jgi:fucose 4-O-acetylase-like acetyltransferase
LAKTNKGKANREAWLDIAKCFCIVLVVLSHTRIRIPIVTYLGGMFFIPLFFVAAGYTYRNKGGSFRGFVLDKAKRLLIPYFVCNLLLVGYFSVTGGVSKPALLGIFYSRSMLMVPGTEWNMGLMNCLNSPTWFLTCLFLVYCIYYVIDCKVKDANQRRTVILFAMAVSVILVEYSPILFPWSLENALFFLGFVEAGRILKEGGLSWLRKNEWIYANFLIGFVIISYLNGAVNVSISQFGKSMIGYFAIGTTGSLLCMKAAELTEKYLKVFAKPLAFVGRHTLPIMCWHLLAIEVLKKIWHVLVLYI